MTDVGSGTEAVGTEAEAPIEAAPIELAEATADGSRQEAEARAEPTAGAPYRQGDAPRTKREPRHRPLSHRELAAWLGLVVFSDLVMWPIPIRGFGCALLLIGLPVLLTVGGGRVRRSPRRMVLGAVLAALALRMTVLPAASTVLAGLGALAAVPLVLRRRRATLPEIAVSWLAAIVVLPARVGAAYDAIRALAARTPMNRTRALSVLVPLLLSLAFVGVFSLANPLVAQSLRWVGELLGQIAFPDPVRVFLWCIVFVGGLFALRPAIPHAHDDETAAPRPASELERLVARNSLIALNLVFLAYLVLDAVYLFDGRPPSGMSTQAYAHQGAFWLTVALVMLTGVIGFLFRGGLQSDPSAEGLRKLAYAWAGTGLLLALGTYQRIAIHIARSGLSDLRIVGILGTTVVIAGMLLTLHKLHRQRSFTWLVRRQLDALALAFVFYAVFPTHYLGAQLNVARIEAGAYGPLLHVQPQSRHVESVAVYLALLDHPDVRVREGVAAILMHQTACFACEIAERTWMQRDLVSEPVLRAIEDAAPRIREALGDADEHDAPRVLAELGTLAAEGASEETLRAIAPAAREVPEPPR